MTVSFEIVDTRRRVEFSVAAIEKRFARAHGKASCFRRFDWLIGDKINGG